MNIIKLDSFNYLVDIKYKNILKIGSHFQGNVILSFKKQENYLKIKTGSINYKI